MRLQLTVEGVLPYAKSLIVLDVTNGQENQTIYQCYYYFYSCADVVFIFCVFLIYQLVGRLDNSAVSATGAKLAFKSNEEVAFQVRTVPLDEVIPTLERVLLLKIDVQGWEYHVLKGASKLLSRKGSQAPYLIYEEDERLLQASNSSAKEIRDFLRSVGYHDCTQHGTDAHCTKKD
jgi:hypothetical protein